MTVEQSIANSLVVKNRLVILKELYDIGSITDVDYEKNLLKLSAEYYGMHIITKKENGTE